MPKVKAIDIAYGRLAAPDLDEAEAFLTTFGMVRAARTPKALYMRGTDPTHHIHVTELGPARFIGLAFQAVSEADLAAFASLPGASPVEAIDEPGGGKRVRLREPNGYQIEIVHGISPLEPLPVRRNQLNWGQEKLRRRGELTRLPAGPSQVKRLGHAVMMTPKLEESLAWFRQTLGLILSDDVYAGTPDNIVLSFNRIDRGDQYVDHHVFLCVKGEKTGLNHLAFEVQDIDDVMLGHEHLKAAGKYRHVWGIGRHILGSQVFDYWFDPWGRAHEHWTDVDMLNASTPGNLVAAEDGLDSQWGDAAPQSFIEHASP
ncbi:MAG TPA: VOC family protein [Alphaproteobacteria bacterium]|nr:VOC family protein [Alphaproteobacteria bacterium]